MFYKAGRTCALTWKSFWHADIAGKTVKAVNIFLQVDAWKDRFPDSVLPSSQAKLTVYFNVILH